MKTVDRITWSAVALLILIGLAALAGFVRQRMAAIAAHEAAIAARDKREPWRLAPDWIGTKAYPKAGMTIPPEVSKAFEDDPAPPNERVAMFKSFPPWFSKYRLLGWVAAVDSVTPTSDGWEVGVEMGVKMGFTAFTQSHTNEIWEVSKDGRARFLKCTGTKAGDLIFD